MFKQALLPDTFRAIQLVSRLPVMRQAYLAGGTALALQLGHRISVDLDFFTRKKFKEEVLGAELSKIPGFVEEGKAWRTVWGEIGKTKFSIFYYQYPLIRNARAFSGVSLASKADIAAMKIHAIEDRGTRRDFIDVYCLAKEFSLEKMLDFYDQKYAVLEDHLYHILRSLNYFEEAERESVMPRMSKKVAWEKVKDFFRCEVKRLAKEELLA